MCYAIVAQDEVLNLPIDYKSNFYDRKEAVAITNENNGNLVLFIEDADFCRAILLDKDFVLLSQFQIERLPRSFNSFIGHKVNDNKNYTLFSSHKNEKTFGAIALNFSDDVGTINELDFKLKKEVYIESISHRGKFYLLTATRSSNNVNFYNYANGTLSKTKSVPFNFLEEKKNDFAIKAYNILVAKGFNNGSLVKMDNKIPNAIETTSIPNKLYIINNTFVFTFDKNAFHTKVGVLSAENFDLKTFEINKPLISG